MVKILEYPALEVLHGTEFFWRVIRKGVCAWERSDAPTVTVVVPEFFPTDMASIPRLVWNILPPWDGEFCEAAIFHDYLYASHQVVKADADTIFYEGMVYLKTPAWKRHLLYWAVNRMGQHPYDTGPERWNARKFTARALLAQN